MTTRLLQPHYFTPHKVREVICNNMLLDYRYGWGKIVESFVEKHSEYASHLVSIQGIQKSKVQELIKKAEKACMLILSIMLDPVCNANCGYCCYRDLRVKHLLDREILADVMRQASELGVEVFYLAGQGEPLLDDKVFDILEFAKANNKKVILFTNGIILEKNRGLISRLKQYPVWIYYKLWSLDPSKNQSLLGLSHNPFSYRKANNLGNFYLPQGLISLLQTMGRERVGIETVLLKENWVEILDVILPFVLRNEIAFYFEKLIGNGYYKSFTPPQNLTKFLVREKCTRLIYFLNVQNDGYVIPCLNIHPEFEGQYFNIKDVRLFEIRYRNPYLVKARYMIDYCLCQALSEGTLTL